MRSGTPICGVHRAGTFTLSVRLGLVCGGSSPSELGPLLMSGFIPGYPTGVAHTPRAFDKHAGHLGSTVFVAQHGISLYIL